MKFINKGSDQQVRQEVPINDVNGPSGFYWKKVKTTEIIDLPRKVGKRYGFKEVSDFPDSKSKPKVTEGKIGNKKVETKQFKKKDKIDFNVEFYNELIAIKGIGPETAQDISRAFLKKELIQAIKNKERLPFRNDIEKILRRKYE